MAAVSKRGRGRKALNAVTESEVNISAAVVAEIPAEQSKESVTVKAALLPSKKTKNVKSKSKAETKQETASSPAFADEMERLQAQLQQLQIEKTRTEEMLREKDEILRKKDEEQGKLQAEYKKLQRAKEFKPPVNFPLVKSLVEKEQEEKGKKKKTKSTLKKPCPAYVLWSKDQWTLIKKENPEADFKEISNTLGAKWKGLSAEEKKPYEEQYQQDKEAYLQVVGKEKRETEAMKLLEDDQMQKTAMELLEQYMKFKQDADDMEKKKSRKEKDPLKPKQPMSAFLIFSNERRAALVAENKSVVEVAKITGEEWKNMSEKKKAPYEKIAMKQREQYKQQMEIYNQKKLEETSALEKEEEEQKKVLKQEALQLLKKKEKTENIIKKTKDQKKKQKDENADPNKPKKPASSFILFSKETRKQLHEERPDMPNSTMNALISVKWKELSAEEKQKWNEEAAKNMAEYKKELEEYNKSKPSSST